MSISSVQTTSSAPQPTKTTANSNAAAAAQEQAARKAQEEAAIKAQEEAARLAQEQAQADAKRSQEMADAAAKAAEAERVAQQEAAAPSGQAQANTPTASDRTATAAILQPRPELDDVALARQNAIKALAEARRADLVESLEKMTRSWSSEPSMGNLRPEVETEGKEKPSETRQQSMPSIHDRMNIRA